MTTPQSLTEEQIEQLRGQPSGFADKTLVDLGLLEVMATRKSRPCGYRRSKAGDVVLATLQAERERERERVKAGLTEILAADHTAAYDLRGDIAFEFEISTFGRENKVEALSPDVLGDQKDKGQTTGKGSLTAPEASEELPSGEGSRVAVTEQTVGFVCDGCGKLFPVNELTALHYDGEDSPPEGVFCKSCAAGSPAEVRHPHPEYKLPFADETIEQLDSLTIRAERFTVEEQVGHHYRRAPIHIITDTLTGEKFHVGGGADDVLAIAEKFSDLAADGSRA